MSTVLVEKKRSGHFLLSEAAGLLSREVLTVLSGGNIKAGQVCARNASGKAIPIAATGNEVHTYDPTGAPSSGWFSLTLRHSNGSWVTTGDIAYNANAAAIQAAINAVLGTSAVSVSGTAATAIAITFSGTGYTNLYQPQGTLTWDRLVGVTGVTFTRTTPAGATQNEVQTFDFGAAATGGTLKIGVTLPNGNVVWTDTAAWSATDATYLANIQAVLDQVCGANGIVVSAKAATDTDLALVFTFSGTGFAGLAQPALELDTAALTSVTSTTFTRTTAGGLSGSEIGNKANCIAFEDIDASSADKAGVFIVRHAVVDADALVYGGGDRPACLTALKELDIVARSGGSYVTRGDSNN